MRSCYPSRFFFCLSYAFVSKNGAYCRTLIGNPMLEVKSTSRLGIWPSEMSKTCLRPKNNIINISKTKRGSKHE